MNKLIPACFFCLFVLFTSCEQNPEEGDKLSYETHIFYYAWYGNPEHDGKYYHWSHDILPHWSDTTWNNAGAFQGGDDIGANFYPQLGCYSSNDTATVAKHMEMISDAGVGVFVYSWWGKDSYEDKAVELYLKTADEFGVKLSFHIEPFYEDAEQLREQLDYLSLRYSKHPAIFLFHNKPLYYVYDSYKLDVEEWQKLLTEGGEISVRNTSSDATFIGLWVDEDEQEFFLESGFDGFYTYFASDGFVYGSTASNWKLLAQFAKDNDLLFIPCAGPGYLDTRIRPWNSSNTKERENGEYYERMFVSARDVDPDFIGITSFNEWHEGSQIEPSIPKTVEGYTYQDYGMNVDPWFYIRKTRELVMGR